MWLENFLNYWWKLLFMLTCSIGRHIGLYQVLYNLFEINCFKKSNKSLNKLTWIPRMKNLFRNMAIFNSRVLLFHLWSSLNSFLYWFRCSRDFLFPFLLSLSIFYFPQRFSWEYVNTVYAQDLYNKPKYFLYCISYKNLHEVTLRKK